MLEKILREGLDAAIIGSHHAEDIHGLAPKEVKRAIQVKYHTKELHWLSSLGGRLRKIDVPRRKKIREMFKRVKLPLTA